MIDFISKTSGTKGVRKKYMRDSIIKLRTDNATKINNLSEAFREMLKDWNDDSLGAIKEYRAIGLDNENRIVCKLSLPKTRFTINVLSLLDEAKRENATKVIIGENALMGSVMPSEGKVDFVNKLNDYGAKKGLLVVDQLILNNRSYFSLLNNGF